MNETRVRITLPKLYELQRRAFYHDHRVGVCEATTKGGKTVGAITWQAERWLSGGPYPHHWWVAPIYEQAKIAFGRVVRMFGHLPGITYTHSPMVVTAANGHQWHFRSGEKPDNLYGEDVADAVMDEFTRMREDSYHAILSTVTATMGPLRMIGNVKGRGWGYKLARLAEQDPAMTYVKITADDAIAAGVMTTEALEFARKLYPEDVFRELYYCEPSDNAGNPFGMQHIRAIVAPRSEEATVVYGVDLAKSQDWTRIWGVDEKCRCTFASGWNRVPWNETADHVSSIIGNTPTVMDATGVGAAVADDLMARGHDITPFKFTAQTKQQLMGELRVAIQNHATTLPEDVPEAVAEHEAFEYVDVVTNGRVTNTRYEAPPGLHDDYVDAHALAVHGFNNVPRGETFTITAPRNPMRASGRAW